MTLHPGPTRSRLDPEPVPRRDMLGLASLWSTALAMLFGMFGIARLPKAAVLSSPSKKFRVTLPETLGPGEVFMPAGRKVALFRDAEGVYAVSTVCTHLGCLVKQAEGGFECPCHGSKFSADGTVTKGPAPQPLPWLKVTAAGGAFTVDEGEMVPPGTKVNA